MERGFFPLDRQLEVWDGHWSEQIARQAVRLSGEVDFAEAAQILREVGQVEISATSVWRRVEKWGERLKAFERQEQAHAFGPAAQREKFLRASHSRGRMGVSMDGSMIYIRGEEWKELKVGCFFDVVVLPSVDLHTQERIDLGHALHNSYVSHLGGPEEFGRKLWTEAQRRNWDQAVDTQVVADGAAWIWNLVEDMFSDSHAVVDWFHGKEHLARAAQIRFGEGSPEAKRWLKEQETTLFQGQVERIVEAVEELRSQQPEIQNGLQSEVGYFEKHKRRMHYLDLRTEGWVIGSGMVESGGKQFKHRFAGPGMRWSRAGAERLLPVRTAIMSGRFDQRWKAVYYSPLN